MNICVQSGGLTGHFKTEELFRRIAEAGFQSVDLNIDTALPRAVLLTGRNKGLTIYEKTVPEIIEYFRPTYEAIKKAGLYIHQAHAHFPAVIPQSDLSGLDYSIEVYKKTLELCQAMGCKKLIVHPICYDKNDKAHSLEFIYELNIKLYSSLIETAKKTGVIVCLENLFTGNQGTILEGACADPHDAIELIDKLNNMAGQECFGFCVDTGHLNLVGKNQYYYIKALGKRIKAFHIHDNDGKSDLHLAPYAGTIDWEDFCAAVKEIGYDGDLSFETFAQYKLDRMPETRAVMPWLRLVNEMGKLFKEKIEG